MTSAQPKTHFLTFASESAKEAVYLYFDPLYRLGVWLSGRAAREFERRRLVKQVEKLEARSREIVEWAAELEKRRRVYTRTVVAPARTTCETEMRSREVITKLLAQHREDYTHGCSPPLTYTRVAELEWLESAVQDLDRAVRDLPKLQARVRAVRTGLAKMLTPEVWAELASALTLTLTPPDMSKDIEIVSRILKEEREMQRPEVKQTLDWRLTFHQTDKPTGVMAVVLSRITRLFQNW